MATTSPPSNQRASAGALAAGAAAAGLAGGLVIGRRIATRRGALTLLPTSKRTVLGVPVGRRSRPAAAALAVAGGARRVAAVASRASKTVDDIHEARVQLESLNRRSPVEALLDGLTHRRGAHKRET
jgi:hypothetical protein